MTPTIESVGLHKRFGTTTALDGLDLVPSRGAGPGRARRDRQPMIWAAPKTSTPHLQAGRRTPGCNQRTAERQGG
jgi:hypothetical protein